MNRHFVDYNAIPATCAAMTDPVKTPSQIAKELEDARKAAQVADAKAYESMKAPDAPVKRDEPYRPEFDFQYVDHKGHLSDTVIPKREAPAALGSQPESIITPLAPSAGVVADAPTEWQSAPPSERGWFNALDKYDRAHEIDFFARYWDGSAWGGGVAQSTDVNTKIEAAGLKAFPRGLRIDVDIRWRGPRLVGDAWPEPRA